ncbi:phage tail protein [Streptococcus parauberis]|uniref:phage tail protein n=1 Tax=Streptococcus parauberis TaxID=1348 RepID=UPI00020CBF17|nr:phage tail protein [Streptococcus parauberis]AEF25294.1 host specificity protein [Streptococcus parauberis KCTC 11537]QBX17913.1 tail fibers protein [Streptococcus phage Javan385]UWM91854.1 phage tail protein [Streptococcus parauberis]
MQITIRDRQLKKLTAINNDIPEMLSFQDETLHLYKENSTATFDFSIPKYYFGKLHKDVDFINDDIYISLIDDGRPYYFYVHTLVQDDFRFTLTCNDANLEYTMEQANPFINTEAHNINWYLKQMSLLDFAGVYVGLNEISDITRTLSFDNQQTKLERLSSLINQFGGEFELVTEVDKNGKYKGIRLDIYHEADDTHHGVGKIRGDVTLKYGKEVTGVQVTSVKEGFFNAGVFTGENGLNISDVEKTVKDEDGNVLFYTHAGSQMVYAPQSRDKYPSNVLSSDRWTRRDFSTNYTNKSELIAYTFKTIEQLSKPQITFLVSAMSGMLNGIKDLSIGDTVFIYDKNFKNGLLLKARVSEIIKCYTQPNNSAYVFTNYEVIKNNISSTLRSRIDEILESKIPYDLRILTNNGLQFKNSNGTSIISPELWKNNKKLNATFRFKNRDVVLGSGLQFTVDPKQFIDILNLTIEAYIGNEFIASKQLTFSNVNDGQDGVGVNSTSVTYGISTSATVQPTNWTEAMPVAKQGEYLWKRTITDYTDPTKSDTIELTYNYQGKDGTPGTSLTVSKTEYQAGTSGIVAPTGTWTIAIPTVADGQFLWMKATMSDNSTIIVPTKQGAKGKNGKDGVSVTNNIASYTLSTSGTTAPPTGWSSSIPTLIKGQFLWTKNELTLSDSTTKTSYSVTYIPNDGINGQTPVVHTAYANSQNGAVDFSITDSTGRRFIGQYVDYSTTNSTDYTKYKWVDMVGTVKVGGVNLLPNSGNFENLTGWINYASVTSMTLVDNKIRVVSATSGIPRIANKTLIPLTSTSQELTVSVEYISSGEVTLYSKSSDSLTAFNETGSQVGGTLTKISTTVIDGDRKKTIFNWKTLTATDTIKSSWLAFAFPVSITSDIINVQVEMGNVSTNWRQAPEDIQSNIDSKADQLLTQQQILALEEKTTLARENAIAEAMQNTISEVEQKWQLWYDTNTKDEKQQVANDIASLMQRTAELDYKLGEASAKFSFINNETIIGEDGVAIGDKAGKAKLFMSGDSISFLTNGVAQMTLTGDTLSIKNGLFTERIQIGNFVEEVYDKNPLFNVIRAIKNS